MRSETSFAEIRRGMKQLLRRCSFPHLTNEKPFAVLSQSARHTAIPVRSWGRVAVFAHLVDLISAFKQIGVLIGALMCGGLGALLVGHAVYWRLHAARVQGQVIGVRQ